MHTDVEATLVADDDDAVSTARSTLLLWGFGLTIIIGNMILNPLWEGPWLAKLWLPAVYVGGLVLLLMSKYNRKIEHGKIVFEQGWIRISPKGGEKVVYRIAELQEFKLIPGKPGFFRNPLATGSLGSVSFQLNNEWKSFSFRLHKRDDVGLLKRFGLLN
jgi:hypothetical protein